MTGRRWLLISCWALLLFSGTATARADDDAALRPIRIQLKWRHQFQFAGYYAAIDQGYFHAAGLDVTLLEGGPTIDPVEAVADGRAEFGVGNSGLMLDRAKGAPVRVVAAILQRSPFVLAVKRTPEIDEPRDLVQRTMMLEPHAAELSAYLKLAGAPLSQLRVRPHSGDPRDLARDVDAMSIYTTDELYELITEKISHQIFNPRSIGVDFYGDALFTADAVAAADPALVRVVRDAVIRGWYYALEHPNQMQRLIQRRYAPEINPLKLAFEAEEIRRLIGADVIEIGYMNPLRWRRIKDTFVQAGMLPADFDVDAFLFELPNTPDLTWVYRGLAVGGGLLVIALTVAATLLWANVKLRREVTRRRTLEETLRRQATTDSLTGLDNRRSFFQHAEEAFRRKLRLGGDLSVIYLDLDHFKAINDRWGHGAGDRALVAAAQVCAASLRDIDTVGRIGGEEFAALLPGASLSGAVEAAERLRVAIAACLAAQTDAGAPISITASLGVATVESGDATIDAACARADQALYQAKHDGRNCVRVAVL